MLLVTGATGTTGTEVLRALKARGVAARGLVRDETKAHHLRDLGFEPATGDLGDPRTLGPALEGVEKAYLVSPIGPMQSEFELAFLETAKEAGVKHIVKLSVIGASPEAPLRFARTHAKVEAALRASGMMWTLLRPTGFMQNTLSWGPRVLDGTFYSPVPDAAFSIVDARDVAEVAAVALTEESHENKAYGLSGPEAVSFRDQARRVFAAAGREIKVEEIELETLKRELVRAGVPPWNAEGLSELFEMYASGAAQMVTSGVKDALAREPRTIDEFAKDHVDAFKEAKG
ncbi:MAG TPA: SDR family oxidoreductase [Solirubrobacter sp.]|nr:SDR family oxidoreductase [Solirubrobacter sp.]